MRRRGPGALPVAALLLACYTAWLSQHQGAEAAGFWRPSASSRSRESMQQPAYGEWTSGLRRLRSLEVAEELNSDGGDVFSVPPAGRKARTLCHDQKPGDMLEWWSHNVSALFVCLLS